MDKHPFRAALEARDIDALTDTLADDVVFHSPVIKRQAFEGKASVRALYSIVLKEFHDLTFTHEFRDAETLALFLTATVRGEDIRAAAQCDLDVDGKVSEVWLMSRSLRGGVAIVEAIGTNLTHGASAKAARAAIEPGRQYANGVDLLADRLIRRLNREARLPQAS